ncbi:hypothetical protein PoB_006433100 [Plakobranchus ocellatus]|uniref:Uncharacterized protein n=1 Tax=Plakobranchus ocellatus TaxID=259542 RepID=A0AAV4D0U1_9GAST|nr:hypothetical protein PoB_006433100 [Plakobranchus ocellatus]
MRIIYSPSGLLCGLLMVCMMANFCTSRPYFVPPRSQADCSVTCDLTMQECNYENHCRDRQAFIKCMWLKMKTTKLDGSENDSDDDDDDDDDGTAAAAAAADDDDNDDAAAAADDDDDDDDNDDADDDDDDNDDDDD